MNIHRDCTHRHTRAREHTRARARSAPSTPRFSLGMDFTKALAVLQQRTSAPLAVEHGGVDPRGGADSATAPTAAGRPHPQQQCLECDEAAQREDRPGGAPAAEAVPTELHLLSVSGLLRVFFERQEARVAVYRRFEDGFNLFLQVAEANGYEGLVASTTTSFSEISAAVNRVEGELRERAGAAIALAATLRSIQQLEKEKLQITAQLHILRHGLRIDEVQLESDDEAQAAAAARTHALRSEEAQGLRQRLTEITTAIGEALDELRAELTDAPADDDDDVEMR